MSRRVGIARQRRLPRPRQPEEQRGVAGRADVRRTVHRHHVAQRQQVVHHGEDRLLDLPRVARAADQNEPPREVEQDERTRIGPVACRVGRHRRDVDHGELRGVAAARRACRLLQEHRAREQAVPRPLGDDAYGKSIRGIGPREAVLNVQDLVVEGLHDLVVQRVEPLRVDRTVDLPPPDVRGGGRLVDEELVVRRPPGVRRRQADQRAGLGDHALAVANRLFVQRRGTEIPVQMARPYEVEDRGRCHLRRCLRHE